MVTNTKRKTTTSKHVMSGEEAYVADKLWLWRYSRPKEFERRVDALLKEVKASKRNLAMVATR